MPYSFWKKRRTRAGSMPRWRSSVSLRRTDGSRSISESSPATHSGGRPSVSSGRQRLQGRKPANSASFGVG